MSPCAVRILNIEINPLRTVGGSDRSRCGTVRILNIESEPSADLGWVGVWRGAMKVRAFADFGWVRSSRCGMVQNTNVKVQELQKYLERDLVDHGQELQYIHGSVMDSARKSYQEIL